MPRWTQALLASIFGLVVGLFYGWRIAPVEYVDLAPNTLRADYRADYVLMVAESYQSDQDLELATRHLALLGSTNPVEIITKSLEENNYAIDEIKLLEELLREIEIWQLSLAESAQ